MEYIQYRRQREARQERLDAWIREQGEARGARPRRPPPMPRRDPVEFFHDEEFFQLFRYVIVML